MKDNQVLLARESASTLRQSQTHPLQRILVVDGDDLTGHLSTEVLIHSGYEVGAAEAHRGVFENAERSLAHGQQRFPAERGAKLAKLASSRSFAAVIPRITKNPDG